MIQQDRKNIDPEQVRKLAGWGLTQNDTASFVGWSPQPSAVGPVPHQPVFHRLMTIGVWYEKRGLNKVMGRNLIAWV